jgi:hypothetical protein
MKSYHIRMPDGTSKQGGKTATHNHMRPSHSLPGRGFSDYASTMLRQSGQHTEKKLDACGENQRFVMVQTPAPAPGAQPRIPPPPTPAAPKPAAPKPAPAVPSLSLSNDAYVDAGNKSEKTIGFDVTVPSGLVATDYCLVNKLQGFAKEPSGSFSKAVMYGSTVDANFSTEQVDSVDVDPVYWSNSSARWNYTSTSGGFRATDSPGTSDHSYEAGRIIAFKFKIGLYKLADVPTTTSGTISSTPITELPWQYSVSCDAAGKISHPTL